MGDIAARKVRVAEVATASPSPFARSLLFGYVGMFLYEADAPLAERRAAALSLDSTLLAELLGSEAIRELLDPEVVVEVERSLQRLAPDRHARDAEGAADLLRFLGPLSTAEAGARGIAPEWLTELEMARRVIRVRIAGEERWSAIEDAGRVRDALGVPLPVGVPEAFTEPVPDPVGDLLMRHARTHGPFRAAEAAARFGLGVAVVSGVLDRLVGIGRLVRGELRPAALATGSGDGTEYCDAEVLRRLRRASLARLRSEVEPVEQRALGRFLPAWQGVQVTPGGRRGRMRRAPGVDDVLGVVEQLAGAPLPASALESLILPARLPGYTPALLDELTAAGEVTWTGCGALAGVDGWLALAPTDVADLLLPEPDPDLVATPLHRALLTALGRPDLAPPESADPGGGDLGTGARPSAGDPSTYIGGGALFFRELAERAGRVLIEVGEPAPGDDAVVAAIWDLLWAGLLTNDTMAPLRARLGGGRGGGAHRTRRAAPRGPLRPAASGTARDAQPVRPGVGRRPVGRRTGPRARSDPAGARPGRGVPRAARSADPRRTVHRARRRRVRRCVPGAAGDGGLRALPPRLHRRGSRRSPVRGAGGDRPGTGDVAAGRRRIRAADVRRRAVGRRPSTGGRSSRRRGPQGPGTGPSRVVLAAADPAQPYGAALPWPATVGETAHRPGRKAGALVVLVDGAAVLYVERGGRSLLSFTEERGELQAAAEALAGAVHEGWLGTLAVERADGVGSLGSALADVLTEAGFRVTPKGLRLRA